MGDDDIDDDCNEGQTWLQRNRGQQWWRRKFAGNNIGQKETVEIKTTGETPRHSVYVSNVWLAEDLFLLVNP